ncbi:class I SAM-dependent methyltransferase [Zunongwangia endophytica]|uniref:Class I SAM-dependent methyltransferase n=1 Tax=Zunongwangia endophytica TaxID=1808945 RepID=A0ABV8H986_9FLAO|nr:methyltransferase domain-containing protein [Zunongwangia endophytica]MDN3595011.1 methyltransferase domain-containing protein [Zunongwangia endophytica]
MKEKDIFGMAMKAFYFDKDETPIIVHSPDFDDDEIAIEYLFRSYSEMPKTEQKALQLSHGKVLDVGCGAGSHSLYLQQKGIDVKAIDTSEGSIAIAKERRVDNAKVQDFYAENEQYDTLLFLMNGTGIIGNLINTDNFLNICKELLKPEGQILIDSSDLSFLEDEEEPNDEFDRKYIGEIDFSISYKGKQSEYFPWLYLDFDMLKLAAKKNNFNCELIVEGDHFDYLAKLTLKND